MRAAARIIYLAHEDAKDKEFELEMTWVSGLDGPTRGLHVPVPPELVKEHLNLDDALVAGLPRTKPIVVGGS